MSQLSRREFERIASFFETYDFPYSSNRTEYFAVNPSFAGLVADWLAERLAARSVR